MKWLQDNPLGMALAALSGFLLLLVLVMALVWTVPVSVDVAEDGSVNAADNGETLAPDEIGPLGDYRIINERPVFSESRSPVIAEVDPDDGALADDAIEVKDAPDVRLTGVIITPAMKIASLTPVNTALESVMAHEGQALTGEFVGWQVSTVNPRTVVLESRDGQKLELELQVHDSKIKEPPKVQQPAVTAQESAQEAGEDDEPLSRAEQIRQRIAERREELRMEQEAKEAAGGSGQNGSSRVSNTSNYQNAIRAMMKNKSKDQSSDDKQDG